MVKLTERLVLARSRASDLENVRKLNCWASELTDVSIIRKMTNVQIVSLSVNQLASLEYFSSSTNLEELYIRKNEIKDLEEIWHLRKLPRLRVLWLADNPCATGEKYRLTVLKTLPNLQRLDNVPVTEEELNEAIGQGIDLQPLVNRYPHVAGSEPFVSQFKTEPLSEDETSVVARPDHESVARPDQEESRTASLDKEDKENLNTGEKVLELEGGGQEKKRCDKDTTSTSQDMVAEFIDNLTPDSTIQSTSNSTIQSTSNSTIQSTTNSTIQSTANSTIQSEYSPELVTGGEKSLIVKEEPTDTQASLDVEVSTPNLARVQICDEEEEEEREGEEDKDDDSIEEGEVLVDNPYKETNEIREQLGLKPVPEEKVMQPVKSRPSNLTKVRNSNILNAVLHLIRELDTDSLEIVSDAIRDKLDS